MSTDTKQTKGDWKVTFYGDGCRIYSDNFGAIASIPHMGKAKEEHEANAKIICAAPDMLKALERFRDEWVYNGTPSEKANNSYIEQQIYAAIKKATE